MYYEWTSTVHNKKTVHCSFNVFLEGNGLCMCMSTILNHIGIPRALEPVISSTSQACLSSTCSHADRTEPDLADSICQNDPNI